MKACVRSGLHNFLQESISRMEGFEGLGSILGYMEVFGVLVFSYLERYVVGQFTRRRGRASALLRDWPIFSERVAIVWQRGARRLQGSRHTAGCA